MIRAPSPTLRSRKIRSASDHRRYTGDRRRHHACTSYHPGDGRICQRYGRSLPEHPVSELHQPDGDADRLYMQRYTKIRTVGHNSVQVCSEKLLEKLGMEDKLEGRRETDRRYQSYGMAVWNCMTKTANDLYPEIRRRAAERMQLKNTRYGTFLSTSNILILLHRIQRI